MVQLGATAIVIVQTKERGDNNY